MHVYKELTQPTAVTHSVACRFIDKDETCLVVIRGNSLIEIFRTTVIQTEVVEDINSEKEQEQDDRAAEESALVEGGDSFVGSEFGLESAKEQLKTKLVLVGQWPLEGYVTDIHKVKTMATDPALDGLMISFKHAKMSLVVWDQLNSTISTVSLHYYEKELANAHFADQGFESYFRIDSQNSCSCMMYQQDQLAFLPFYKDDSFGEEGAAAGGNAAPSSIDSETPLYQPSFLINATRLDESLTNIIDFAFLYEYREPTMALIYQPTRSWTGTLPLHKDTVRYMVLSLDLQQRSSTAIISVQGLPHDISSIIPLEDPISGSLLVSPNTIIHIDSSGKVTAVAVNSLAKHATGMQLIDQSNLELRLEGCKIVQLEDTNGQFLMILTTGELCKINFKVEGRRVYGFHVSRLSNPKSMWMPRPSTAVMLPGMKNVFVGARGGSAQLLGVRPKGEESLANGDKVAVAPDESGASGPGSKHKGGDGDGSQGDVDNDDDDIYGDESDSKQESNGIDGGSKNYVFSVDDRLVNYGPITSLAVGKPRVVPKKLQHKDPRLEGYDIVAATGIGVAGSLTVFQKDIRPNIVSDLKLHTAQSIWSLCTRNAVTGGEVLYDNYICTSSSEGSTLYKIENKQLKNFTKASAFKGQSSTIGIGTVSKGTAVVQVLSNTAVIYDAEFKTAGKKVKLGGEARQVSFQDPYALVILKNGECTLLQSSTTAKSGKPTLDVVKQFPKNAARGALSESAIFGQLKFGSKKRKRASEATTEEADQEAAKPMVAICLTNENELEIFKLGDQDAKVTLRGLSALPETLGEDVEVEQCSPNVQKPEFVQVLFTPLGDGVSEEEHLLLLTAEYELYMYRAFIVDGRLRFSKVRNQAISADLRLEQNISMIPVQVGGYKAVCLTGSYPQLIVKGHTSPPRTHRFGSSGVIGMTTFNTDTVYKGVMVVDDKGVVRICTLSDNFDYTQSQWPARQIPVGSSINRVCYHEKGRVYAISTSDPIPYNYVDEDGEPIEGLLEDVGRGESYQSSLKLISPLTWTVIDEKQMEPNEVIMCLKSVQMLVSERTQRHKEVLAFGTSVLRGEDLAAKGSFYVYDAVDIVPEPGKPETDRRLKELAQESVKGAVTSLCEVDGHLLIAQGQKVVVRNLQEDNSIIPVAFLDMNMYINEAKSVKNMLLLGDALTSVWLVGFGQEPYRMNCMGKDLRKIPVSSSEFVISDGDLYGVVADAEKSLHLLQYDPENPTSLSGQKLLPKADFFTGRHMQTMELVPTNPGSSGKGQEFVPLCGSDDGVLATILPVSEATYRNLFVVQQQIIDKDEHTACLNPRMHREMNASPHDGPQRAMLDYNIIQRYATLNVEKRYQYSRKVGKNGCEDTWNSMKTVGAKLVYL